MVNQAKISAIIPTYNGSKTIGKAIDSVLLQSYPVMEIIVVDDGSTDFTLDVVKQYPVEIIERENGGPAAARNSGAMASTGEFLAFLDHDDTWHLDKNLRQIEFFSTEVDAVFCEKFADSDDLSFEQLFFCNFAGNPSGSIVRRSAFFDLKGFDESFDIKGVDDYDFWLRFLFNGYKYKTTANLYDFTPAIDHYGGKFDKMFFAEIYALKKAQLYSGLPVTLLRKRLGELQSYALKQSFYRRDFASITNVISSFPSGPLNLSFWSGLFGSGADDTIDARNIS